MSRRDPNPDLLARLDDALAELAKADRRANALILERDAARVLAHDAERALHVALGLPAVPLPRFDLTPSGA